MKKIIISVFFLIIWGTILYSQTTRITGNPIAEIFTDFHYNFNDSSKTTGFGINRAYLGYNFIPGDNFSATIIINIGTPDDLVEGATPRRYAFFREASLSYSKNKLTLTLGMTSTKMFDYQQKFWGKRYVANTYQSINGYGYVADIGFSADYKINDIFKADFTLMNGKGYSELQSDNNLKSSAGIYITPNKLLVFRLYGDIIKFENLWQSTLIAFAGIKNDLITLGAEVSYKTNLDHVYGHHAWGISGTGAIRFAENTEFFGRYDHSASIIRRGRRRHRHVSLLRLLRRKDVVPPNRDHFDRPDRQQPQPGLSTQGGRRARADGQLARVLALPKRHAHQPLAAAAAGPLVCTGG